MIYIKYSRTYHVLWSDGISMEELFCDREVVVTEKMDGENSTIYSNGYFHARSISGNTHKSQDWLKKYLQNWYYLLPEGWRVCGENCYALHSIYYEIENYFNVGMYLSGESWAKDIYRSYIK